MMRHVSSGIRVASFFPLSLISQIALVNASTLVTGKDLQARLPFWEIRDSQMSLRLVQRLPDQTRGYFQARGFTPKQSERIAQSCIFQTVFKNLSHTTKPSPLTYNLKEWKILFQGRKLDLKTREDWKPEWQKLNASGAAQIAFEWSLLPTRQTYAAGDYNWGMTSFNLKPGSEFDLSVAWHQYGKRHDFIIKGIKCAPDIHLTPEEFEKL
jgi:hypothetical protein